MVLQTGTLTHYNNGHRRQASQQMMPTLEPLQAPTAWIEQPVSRGYLEKILEVSRRMAEIKQLDALLEYVLDEAIALVGAERGYVVLAQERGAVKIRAQRGVESKNYDTKQDQISTSIFHRVVATAQPLVLNDAQSDPHFDGAKSVINLRLRSIMCVPLIAKGKTTGAIYVENRSFRNRFTQDDLPPLILFANQAAVAIENAMLIDMLEERMAARTRQLETSWEELAEANKMRTAWLSNIAHDLRAPLARSIAALSLLQQDDIGDVNEMQQKWIGKTLAAIQDAINLTNDFFYLSKLEAGAISLRKQTVSLKEFLRDVYAVARDLPWADEISVELGLLPQLPEVAIDPLRIRQVLLNLLSNAQKFTRRGRVTLYVLERKSEVVIGVKDTGDGISADKLGLLFQRFQQVDDDSKGSGLGLAICRELVEMHGGRIWVESTAGQGSDFRFTLPVPSGKA